MENKLDMGAITIEYSSDANLDLIKVIDPIDTSDDFRTQVWIPYMGDLYNVYYSLGTIR